MTAFLFLVAPVCASIEDEATQIVDSFYDLGFERAIQSAQDLQRRHPDSPAGDFYISVAYYQRYLLEDPPSAGTFSQFEQASGHALEKAVKLMPEQPAISHYYQGAALGFQARVFVAQRRYAEAIPKARKGVFHLREALKLNPSLIDAKLGMGLYDYFLSRVPPAAKPFAYLMVGMWGDRAKGLALLKEVSEKGGAARREAQSVLAAIDASQKEQRWDEALSLFRDLVVRYPHNPRYRMSLIYVLQRKGQWENSAEACDPEGPWLQDLEPLIKGRTKNLVLYRAAEDLLFAGLANDAGPILESLDAEPLPGRLKEWVALRLGNYWDAEGKPQTAKAYYESIRDKKAEGLAEVFMKVPFPAGPRDVMPNWWPLASVPE
jgi:hypothetical protein